MVNQKLLLPQELETFYIIPTIRKYLAKAMLKQGLRQNEVARIFNVTKATISQYISRKRGNEIKFEKDVAAEIEDSAKKITNTYSYIRETQRILDYIRSTKQICRIHKMFCNVPVLCNPESIGCNKR